MERKIVDNFLEKSVFDNIKNHIIFSGSFPWYTHIGVSDEGSDDGYYFNHYFYNDFRVTSEQFSIITPLLEKIDPIALRRIKANFYPTTREIIKHGLHVDLLDFDETPIPCRGFLFYLNTNNGKTIFEDGYEVESVENRALFFDASVYHQSTTCTNDYMGRFNININYF